ncbi:CYFA0S04e05028g1_1 [Cyberlindnera fabianii]|uniref:CYFA0S04e05028g1_1 n=1 Tax=Cyberlindnera fabianii TaxID=36022 RepID=A0A061AXP2_CYBFA|nr:CYFA0S04e05028g1_1 [Cyberlindnera fabianii]
MSTEAQADVLVKAGDVSGKEILEPLNAETIDSDAVKKAEEEALQARRDPVPATSVGWKQIGEWEEKDALTADDELMDLTTPTFLDAYIPDAAYGEWYHTVGVFIGAGFLSFVFGWFNFSLAPVFFIVVAASVYYRTSIKKYRSIVRDEIQREFTIKHIENDYETMDWMNTFLEKYWIYLEPSISQIVTEQANPIIAAQPSIPAFVKAVWIDEFTAGTKPPRIDFVKTLNIPKDDVVVMDWGFSFTPHDIADNSAKQLKNRVNQRVVVKATLFGITIPVVVENVAVSGFARVRLKMMTKFPHIDTVNITMMEPPKFDFVSKLFGESIFNWEVLAFPGLLPLINEMVKKFVGPMVFEPFSFQLNVPQLLSGSNTSVGILTIKAREAKDLRAADRVMGNTVDPYLTFNFHGKPVAAKTKTILDTLEPKWNETVHVLVGSFADPLEVTVYDYNPDRKDKNIGRVQIEMEEIAEKRVGNGIIGKVIRNSKPCGEILYDYEFNPTLEPTILEDGSTEPPPDLNTGLTKIEFTEIRNIGSEDEKLTTYTEFYFNDELVQTTGTFKKNNNPTFNIPFETIVTDRRKAKVKVLVKDPKGKIIAASIQPLNNLVDRTEIDNKWVPFTKGEGEYQISAVWKSVELKGVAGTGGYTEPIGAVRVLFNKGESLRNLETIGKVDPYGRVLVNGIQKARTDLRNDTLDPVWNEALWITVTSPNQKLTIEVMDAQKNGNDRTLGSFNVKTSDIIEKDDDDKYLEHIDKEMRTGRLVHKKGPKGILTYALSFYPVIPVKTLEDLDEEQKAKERKEKEAAEEAALEAKEGKKKTKGKTKADEEPDDDFNETSKVQMSLEELITYPTGVFVFTIVAGEYSSLNSYVQFFFDEKGYPDHVSGKITSKNVVTPDSGDAIVKELEWSTCTIRLVKDKDNSRADECIAESTLPTLALLKNTYHQPNILTLTGLGKNKLKIQTQWIPMDASKLPPSDLITNTGTLDLDIISAEGLPSSDSNGKSDPFIKVYVNDDSDNVYKTKTIKKTLDPVWNEKTSLEISNRVNTVLKLKVLDWDFGAGQDDKLGVALFDLADIDPINPSTYDVPVIGEKGEPAGVVHLKTSFRPSYIVTVSDLKSKSAAQGLKSVGTGVGGVGKTVIGGGAGVVGKVTKGLFGKKEKEEKE